MMNPTNSPRPTNPRPRFGLIIIGDEILSGKRADKHLPKVIALLKARERAGRRPGADRQIGHSHASAKTRAANITAEPFKGRFGLRRAHFNLQI